MKKQTKLQTAEEALGIASVNNCQCNKICILDDAPEKNNDGKTYTILATLGKWQILWWNGYRMRCEVRLINKTKHKIMTGCC